MNQCELILRYILLHGSITPAEAYENLGIMRLGARIHELKKQGYNTITERETKNNRYGNKVTYARYRIQVK